MLDTLNTNKIVMHLILFILFLKTVYDILIFSGVHKIPSMSRFFSLRENFYDERIEKVIDRLGINTKAIKITNRGIQSGELEFSIDEALNYLIILLVKYSENYPEEICYGRKTPHKSKFYINTLEASNIPEDNIIMSRLVYLLYARNYNVHPPIDFVIVSKVGNVGLAQAFAKEQKIPCIICKSVDDPSKVNKAGGMPAKSNFEGFSRIESLIKNRSDKTKLNGIVVDCNCSGGSSIIKVSKEFNNLVRDSYSNDIELVKFVYVLFRADVASSPEEIDKKFKGANLELCRYIDLDEELKKMIFNNKRLFGSKNFEVSRGGIKLETCKLKKYAKEKGLLQ